MKSDLIFGLENAGWPALLVDHSATIRRASQAAKSVFGSSMEGTYPGGFYMVCGE